MSNAVFHRSAGASGRFVVALRPGLLALVALFGTFATVMLLDPEPGPVVLGIALTVSLSRSQLERDLRGRLEALAALPVLGLAAVGIGLVLERVPLVGAVLYVVALTGSVLLRLPGGAWRRVGALVAMPFVALLVVPPAASERFGPVGRVLVPVAVSVLAWAWVTIVQLAARRIRAPAAAPGTPAPSHPDSGGTPASDAAASVGIPQQRGGAPNPPLGEAVRRGRASVRRPSATVRLAIQLGVAVSAAFTLGLTLFPGRWHWLVVTVVILTAGARGRADVLDKALHRLIGAAIGTVLVLLVVVPAEPSPVLAVTVALAALALGVLLRQVAYGLWAFAITVALAMVEHIAGAASPLLALRLEEILVGAVVAVLPAMLLLPVRSADVVRSRVGAVLRALTERISSGDEDAGLTSAAVETAMRELDLVARPFDELTALLRPLGRRGPLPGVWIRSVRELVAEIDAATAPAGVTARRALGDARRALREPERLEAALAEALEKFRGR